jgi:hypothetical protein
MLKLRENVQKLSEVLFCFEGERPFTVARRVEEGGCDLADFVDLMGGRALVQGSRE